MRLKTFEDILQHTRKSAKYNLYLSYFLIVIVVIITMFSFIFKIEQVLLRDWLTEANVHAVSRVTTYIDNAVFRDRIDFITRLVLQDLFEIPELQAYLVEGVAPKEYDYAIVTRVQQYLESLSASFSAESAFIQNISIYYKAANRIISPLGTSQPSPDDKVDIFGVREPDTSYRQPFLWSTSGKSIRYVKQTSAPDLMDSTYINVIRKIPEVSFPKTRGGSINVTLSEALLSTEFSNILSSDPGTAHGTRLILISRDGTIVSAEDKTLLDRNIDFFGIDLSAMTISERLIRVVGENDYLFVLKPSAVTAYLYVLFTPLSSVTARFSQIPRLLLVVALMTLLVGALLAAFSARRIFAPIVKIADACRRKLIGHSLDTDDKGNEYSFIGSTVNLMSDKLESNEQALKEAQALIGRHILDVLLVHDVDSRRIAQELRIARTMFMLPFYCVVIVRLVPTQRMRNDRKQAAYLGEEIAQGIEAFSRNMNCAVVSSTVDNDMVVLVNCDTADDAVHRLVACIRNCCFDLSGIRVLIGVSGVDDSLEKAPAMYGQAQGSLRYAFLYPEHEVFDYADACQWDQNRPESLREKFQKVKDMISRNTWTEIDGILEALLTDIAANNYSCSYVFELIADVWQAFVCVARTHSIKLVEETIVLDEFPDSSCSLPELMRLLKQTGDHISNVLSIRKRTRNLQVVEMVQEYLRTRIGADHNITLNNMAKYTGTSPAHLSRIFRDVTGINFVNYLGSCRLEYSRQLLRETSDHVSNISQRIGYSNVHYFIKKFKSRYGTTPNEYRMKQRINETTR